MTKIKRNRLILELRAKTIKTPKHTYREIGEILFKMGYTSPRDKSKPITKAGIERLYKTCLEEINEVADLTKGVK